MITSKSRKVNHDDHPQLLISQGQSTLKEGEEDGKKLSLKNWNLYPKA
ncbi:hypothetical protein B6N60_01558 [Richelia sinica FACHB-800]|uniref:Uncharacterized protein n=1 Tax=Richelia sinica FACHB-800 TaxID=1357546 RepID=A0A975Y478_9NOST|nr:hypothetical protein B6N60_01558 [Richelia sinica FACHB-800]